MIKTTIGNTVSPDLIKNYFKTLVGRFFKILPIRENEESSLSTYIRSFQTELMGCKEFIPQLQDNASYLTLLSILQYLHDNPEAPVYEVKREVFRAISICNKLKVTCFKLEVPQ